MKENKVRKSIFAKMIMTLAMVMSILVVAPSVVSAAATPKLNKTSLELTVGKKFDLNINNKIKKATYTWSSNDKTVATVDNKGVVIGVNDGEAKVYCKVKSSKGTYRITCKVTVKGLGATVATQDELLKALKGNANTITIKTSADVNFEIPAGNYSKKKLVVEAPNSDVTNSGTFASIEIKQIKSNTWYEKAVGNLLKVLASDSRIVISPEAKVSIEVTEAGAVLKIENNGVVEQLAVQTKADIQISGDSKDDIPVVVAVPNITIKTSVPLNLECKAKVELVLEKGAEATKVQAETEAVIPTIKGDISLKVTVGTGDKAIEKTVAATPVNTTPSGPIGGGAPSAPNSPNNPPADPTLFYLNMPLSQATSIDVTYKGMPLTVPSELLVKLRGYLSASSDTLSKWAGTTNTPKSYMNGAVTVTVTGDSGSYTKTVTITAALLQTRSYRVTVSSDVNNPYVTIQRLIGGNTSGPAYTVTKVDDSTLRISPAPAAGDLVFLAH